MRCRSIKPGFFKNEQLAECDPLARILFAGLWCVADRDGRLEDRPKRIKAEVLPYDEADVDRLLDRLHAGGFIRRYQVAGVGYVQVLKFEEHQHPHQNEQSLGLPPPPAETPVITGAAPESSCTSTGAIGPLTSSLVPSSLVPSSLGSGEPAGPASPPTADPVADDVVLSFPIVGHKTRKTWPLTRQFLDEHQDLYPNLDVLAVCRRALAWIKAKPERRKTAKGMPAFLVNWLNGDSNRGRGGAAGADPGGGAFAQKVAGQRARLGGANGTG